MRASGLQKADLVAASKDLMLAPPSPVDEHRRIATLRRLRMLDTPPEERFDRLARLAKRLFDVPTATITLVDADRQWFKSSIGLSATESSREVSFCGHAIITTSTMVVPDARLDWRFHDNPFVTGEPHVRFYAGCPLTMPDGSTIGTLCVMDSQPREFGKNDCILLSDLARMVEQEFASVQVVDTDELTALPDRRTFKTLAQHALDQCRRLNLPAAMILMDLKEFKKFNDRHGHVEGDRALRSFASVLRETSGDSDTLGRIGGDEFAVLLWNRSESQATAFLQLIRDRLAEISSGNSGNYGIEFTAGCVATRSFEYISVDELLAKADARMYVCKRANSIARLKVG